MNDPKQPPSISKCDPKQKSPGVIVHPPDDLIVERYGRTVCKKLAQEHDPDYSTPDVVQGFTAFMKIVVRVKARQLEKNHVNKRRA